MSEGEAIYIPDITDIDNPPTVGKCAEGLAATPEVTVYDSLDEVLDTRHEGLSSVRDVGRFELSTRFNRTARKLSLFDSDTVSVKMLKYSSEAQKSGVTLEISHDYVESVQVTQLIKLPCILVETYSGVYEGYEADDILYTDKKSGKTISVRDLTDHPLRIVPDLWGGEVGSEIRIPPIATSGKLPKPPDVSAVDFTQHTSERWKAYTELMRSFEPFLFFHEIGHSLQNLSAENKYLLEENANQYAFQLYEQVKQAGIDLLPNRQNNEIVNLVDLALASHRYAIGEVA